MRMGMGGGKEELMGFPKRGSWLVSVGKPPLKSAVSFEKSDKRRSGTDETLS